MGANGGACGASELRALRARFCALRARFSFFFLSFWMLRKHRKNAFQGTHSLLSPGDTLGRHSRTGRHSQDGLVTVAKAIQADLSWSGVAASVDTIVWKCSVDPFRTGMSSANDRRRECPPPTFVTFWSRSPLDEHRDG